MDSPDSRSLQPGWLRQCAGRLRVYWPGKMIGTTLGMTTFFVVYFWILHHPSSTPRMMPLTAVDRWIGFRPAALPLYFSLWIYVSLAPALLDNRRELLRYVIAAVLLAGVGLGMFFLWPTMVPPRDVGWSQPPGFAFLQTIDASGNACPSLHVAFAVFTATWIGRVLRQTGAGPWPAALNWLWCAGILYSTLAVRQHVALDVLAGAALGSGFAMVHPRRLN